MQQANLTPTPSHHRVLRLPEVASRTGLSRASVYRLMQLGRFPRSVELSERAVGWRESDLNDWLESRPRSCADPATPHQLETIARLRSALEIDEAEMSALVRRFSEDRVDRPEQMTSGEAKRVVSSLRRRRTA